jgi:signal transduction histidine kinase
MGNSKAKSNGHQTKKGEKGISKIVRIAEEMQADYRKFRKEWADKFNDFRGRFDQIIPAIAQQFAQLQANSQVASNCIDAIDLQQQAMMKINERVYGKLELIDALFQKLGVDADDLDFEGLQRTAQDTYLATAKECVALAKEEREAAIKANQEAMAKAQEEAAKAAAEKAEAEKAEEALQSAQEEDRLVGEPGGPGAPIPEGAEVFGG